MKIRTKIYVCSASIFVSGVFCGIGWNSDLSVGGVLLGAVLLGVPASVLSSTMDEVEK